MILLSETFRRGEKMETLAPGGSFNLSAQGQINKFQKTNKLQWFTVVVYIYNVLLICFRKD